MNTHNDRLSSFVTHIEIINDPVPLLIRRLARLPVSDTRAAMDSHTHTRPFLASRKTRHASGPCLTTKAKCPRARSITANEVVRIFPIYCQAISINSHHPHHRPVPWIATTNSRRGNSLSLFLRSRFFPRKITKEKYNPREFVFCTNKRSVNSGITGGELFCLDYR